MGYSYGYNARGNLALACDNCGDVGGVRKRRCPYTVRGDSLRTVSGKRPEMDYCPAPAVCGACFAKLGGTHGIHGDQCRTGAAAMQERYDAKEAALDAGESFVTTGYGDWHKAVPAGWVGVTFNGRAGETHRLMPPEMYHPGTLERLSDYPYAVPWDGPNQPAKETTARELVTS